MQDTEKLQKVLARAGLGSRRAMEKVIAEGRVKIDGKLADLGVRVGSEAEIEVDGKKLQRSFDDQKQRVLLYHKPTGEICTRSDPEGRPTVFDHLPKLKEGRWISVGRLDVNTSGLLIFTNNGELANKLMHPSSNLEREYAVRVEGVITDQIQEKLLSGIELEDGSAKLHSIEIDGPPEGRNQWCHVVLTEGRNRLVRRIFDSQGLHVNRLIRVRFGNVTLPERLDVTEFMLWAKSIF